MEATLHLLGISWKILLLQFVPFAVALLGLHLLLWRPLLELLRERERSIDGCRQEAELLRGRIDVDSAAIEARLGGARAEGALDIAAARHEALEEAQRIIDAARARAEVALGGAREELAADVAAVQAALGIEVAGAARGTVAELGRAAAARVLGREIPA